jgi:hypothetical protein
MIWTKKGRAVLVCLFIFSGGATATAGILNDHPDAYDNNLGPGTGGRWAGTAPFADGSDLSGTIDFAVFTAQKFNDNFSGLGYAPTDALVYVYQIFNTGADLISGEIVGITNDAQDIGQFDIGDKFADALNLGAGTAQWDFNFPGVQQSQSSWGLAFSSGNIPDLGIAITIDSGSVAVAAVPTPSAIAIPEPTTLCLLYLLSGLSMSMRRNRA